MALEDVHALESGPTTKVEDILQAYGLVDPLWPEQTSVPVRLDIHALYEGSVLKKLNHGIYVVS